MAYLKKELVSRISVDSTEQEIESTLALDGGYTVTVYEGKKSLSLGASALRRFDPWDSSGTGVSVITHLELLFYGTVDVQLGTVSTEKVRFSGTSTEPAHLSLTKLSLTRSSTVGIWLTEVDGSAVTVKGHYGGT